MISLKTGHHPSQYSVMKHVTILHPLHNQTHEIQRRWNDISTNSSWFIRCMTIFWCVWFEMHIADAFQELLVFDISGTWLMYESLSTSTPPLEKPLLYLFIWLNYILHKFHEIFLEVHTHWLYFPKQKRLTI